MRTYVIGDIHGNIMGLQYNINRLQLTKATLIQVGDFGIGFDTKKNEETKLDKLNRFLRRKNLTMLVIRGNHDDPSYFKGNHLYSNLMLLPDYTTMQLNNSRVLFIGGGVSIDRKSRQLRDSLYQVKSYWEDEGFVYDSDLIKTIPLGGINTLFTHITTKTIVSELDKNFITRPDIIQIFANKYNDDELINDINAETSALEDVVKQLPNLTNHYFGHYHGKYTYKMGNTTHQLLNIDEIQEIKL